MGNLISVKNYQFWGKDALGKVGKKEVLGVIVNTTFDSEIILDRTYHSKFFQTFYD